MSEKQQNGLIYGIGILGALLIMAAIVWAARFYSQPEPLINQARAEERKRAQLALQAENRRVLETYDWIDKGKGLVRLPVARAMTLAIQYWQDPVAGRTNLLARVEKAAAKPPAKPNEFE